MERIQLDGAELSEVEDLLAQVVDAYPLMDSEPFLTDATVWSHRLPLRLRKRINDVRLSDEGDGLFVVSGLPLNDTGIGPTPHSLNALPRPTTTRREEAYLVLLGVLLGDLIAWSTQQAGRVIHDVFPVREHQHRQLGTGCCELLTWHTEDAFHDMRSDYVAMLCLRNPQQAPTTFASIASLELSDETKSLLFEPHYTILPDESHRGVTGVDDSLGRARANIEQMQSSPKQLAVLFGDFARPYLRLDPYFMPFPAAARPRRALETLIAQIDSQLDEIVLQPGDVCVMDNYRIVHGRRPFTAHFDGKDRWLKRVLMARDLRKSRTARTAPASRVIV